MVNPAIQSGPVNVTYAMSILDYWRIVMRRQRLIAMLVVVSVSVALVYSVISPKIFESTATLLPQIESKDTTLGGLGALLSAAPGQSGSSSLGLTSLFSSMPASSSEVFVAMLKSRTMADKIIKTLNLMEVYNSATMQDARRALEGNTKITLSKEKVIKIAVEDRDPQRAADIANEYVATLEMLNRSLNVSKASHNRAFIERRLGETQISLVKTEEALKEFQTTKKTVAVEAQAAVMIQAAAQLQAQISAQEVQLEVATSYLSPDNPELARIRSSIAELKKQLYVMESGKGGRGMLPGDRLHPAMITVPQLALEYQRLFRELKVQETLYTLLTTQYEQAKIAEARDTPIVQVLDHAIPAEKKSKPAIRLNMMIAGAASLLVGLFLALFLEYLERLRANEKEAISSTAGM